ncbi:TPA: hypothetical protein IAA92_07440 [Candidatus Galligastranaerophilus intestinigallinarum]|nr:hypothetical protein [Candidatus Galligastranaerophilus intestinigallinarum]
MKKIFYTILFYFLITPFVFAQNILVESMTDFNTNDNEKVFSAKVVEETELSDGKIIKANSTINGTILKTVDAKRGKRNAYIVIQPESFEIDGVVHLIEDENLEAKVVGYSKRDYKKTALDAGLAVGGYFVKGLSQVFYFSKGLIIPDEDKSRIKTAFHNVYENTPFVYIEKGEDVDIEKGDLLVLKVYHSEIPKWRFIKRNK